MKIYVVKVEENVSKKNMSLRSKVGGALMV
jgi:hypothetical protein